jgi:hypothetical protein
VPVVAVLLQICVSSSASCLSFLVYADGQWCLEYACSLLYVVLDCGVPARLGGYM